MANSVTTQVLADGHRNYIVKVVGILDTSDVAATLLVDMSALNTMATQGSVAPTVLEVKEIEYSVDNTLEVRLWWDATADVPIAILTGQGELCFEPPARNNAGAGITGDIMYSTQGWAAAANVSFTFTLHCIKG